MLSNSHFLKMNVVIVNWYINYIGNGEIQFADLSLFMEKKEININPVNNSDKRNNEVNSFNSGTQIIAKNDSAKLDNSVLGGIQLIEQPRTLQTSKLEEIINALLEDSVEYSFTDFLKNIFGTKKKSIFFYNYGLENLKKMMDIDNYLKFNLEMTLIKEVLFDKNQNITFGIISKFNNFKKFFYLEKDELSFNQYDKKDFVEFFNSLEVLFKRQNETDKKIITFITSKLEEQ